MSHSPTTTESPSQTHGWKVYKTFVEEFRSESDRAAVILGVAKLDVVMYQIIQQALLPSASSNDELLDGDTPLSTFSAKINFLYRLGIIDAGLPVPFTSCEKSGMHLHMRCQGAIWIRALMGIGSRN
jgi:hypothetical protein